MSPHRNLEACPLILVQHSLQLLLPLKWEVNAVFSVHGVGLGMSRGAVFASDDATAGCTNGFAPPYASYHRIRSPRHQAGEFLRGEASTISFSLATYIHKNAGSKSGKRYLIPRGSWFGRERDVGLVYDAVLSATVQESRSSCLV